MDSSISPKDEIWFLRMCHHISNAVCRSGVCFEEPRSSKKNIRTVGVRRPRFEASTSMCIVVVILCVLLSYVYLLYCVGIAVFTLDAGLLARSQYSESPATGHLDTGFPWFPCVYKQMLRWFPRFQVATTCLSCSPPDLNLVVTSFIFCIHVK